MKKPTLAVTMGDPSGIGPELILKVLSKKEVYGYCHPVVIGDPKVMRKTAQTIGVDLEIKTIQGVSDAVFTFLIRKSCALKALIFNGSGGESLTLPWEKRLVSV